MLILCTRGIKRSVYCIAMVYASYFCTFYSCNSGTHPTFVVSVLMLHALDTTVTVQRSSPAFALGFLLSCCTGGLAHRHTKLHRKDLGEDCIG